MYYITFYDKRECADANQQSDFFISLGFTLNGTVKILDFGLARLLENADATSNEVYAMSGETGSLRYMAPGKCRTAMHVFSVLSAGY
jgi:serine/threonine protein kinase